MIWTYYINDPDSGLYRQVYPLNTRSLKFKRVLEDEYIHDWRLSLEGEIILRNDHKENHLDYDFLKGLETNHHDEIQTFIVQCDDVEHFTGEFTILDCEFDDYKEIVKFKVQPVDDYTYMQENEDIKVNVIGDKTFITANIYSYWHFYIESRDQYYGDDTYGKLIGVRNINPTTYIVLYVTECVILDSEHEAPSGWVQFVDLEDYIIYQRYPVGWNLNYIYDCLGETDLSDYKWSGLLLDCDPHNEALYNLFTYAYYYQSIDFSRIWIKKSAYDGRANLFEEITYPAYRVVDTLNRIVDFAFPDFGGGVVSTFLFGDAVSSEFPDSVSYYTSQGFTITSGEWKCLIDKSDFIKPNASQVATRSILTWKEIIEYLCIRHNCRWHIDFEGNIRIEHICYYSISDLGQTVTTTIKYKYENLNKPNREFFEEDEVWSEDFTQKELIYGTVPIIAGSTEKTTSHSFSRFFTDIDGLNTHLSELGNDGFVYVEVDTGNAVKTGVGFISGITNLQNANLSMANCLNLYHRHNAYQEDFYIEDEAVEAVSLKRLKMQEDVEFITDTGVDYKDRLTTSIGEGYIESLEYAPVTEYKYKANLSYE